MKIHTTVVRPCFLAVLVFMVGMPLVASAQGVASVSGGAVEAPVKAAAKSQQNSHDTVFAVINGRVISTQEYEIAFSTIIRQRFYHGQIPEGELVAVREEIKTKLVQRVVLQQEAERRKIVPDLAQIEETVAEYEKRYVDNPQWRQNREQLVPELRKQLFEQSQISILDQQIRTLGELPESDVRAFYDKNPMLFTEPDRLRLAVILLALDPSSPAAAWQSTREEGKAIYGRILGGASFEEAARLHSSVNADKEGDMGYLHRGMLPELIQEKIDKFVVGVVNEPMDTLDGVAIFKLLDRVVGKKREFVDVEVRARELLVRERQDSAWKDLINQLVAKADVKFMYSSSTGQQKTSKQ